MPVRTNGPFRENLHRRRALLSDRRTLPPMQPPAPESLLRHSGFVRGLALQLLRDEAQADDVAQDTWLVALEHGPRSSSSLRAWLAQVTRRLALRRLRGGERRTRREARAARDEALPSTLDEALELDLLRQVTEAVARLDEPFRGAVLLRFYEGLAPEEMARRLGLPRATVYSRLRRGLERLRADLDRSCGGRETWSAGLLACATPRGDAAAAGLASVTSSAASGALWMGTHWKLAAAAAGLTLGAVLWQAATPSGDPVLPASVAAAQGEDVALLRPPSAPAPAPVLAQPELRDAPQPASAPCAPGRRATRGSLSLRLLWEDSREPVAGRGFEVHEARSLDPNPAPRRARTGADGTLQLSDLAPGTCRFYDALGLSFQVEVGAGEEREHTELLPRGLTVRGVVVDHQGDPLPGARVWVSDYGNSASGEVAATTDTDGRFELLGVSEGRSVGAFARGARASRLRRLDARADGVLELRFVLAPGAARIHGRVAALDGTPLAAARVRLTPAPRPQTYGEDGARLHGAIPLEVECDEEGRFGVDSIEPGRCALQLRHPGFAPYRVQLETRSGDDLRHDPRLTPGAHLFGRVEAPDGTPLPGAEVQVGDVLSHDFLRVRSDERGEYRLEDLSPVTTVLARKSGVGSVERELTLSPGLDTRWDPVLDPGLTVRGRVVDASGRPWVGWSVTAVGSVGDPESGVLWSERTRTDDDGQFAVLGCPDEPLSLHLTLGPLQPANVHTRRLERPGGPALRIVVPRSALPSASFFGTLVDAEGCPAAAARVSALQQGGANLYGVTESDASGRFELSDLVPGTYAVSLEPQAAPRQRAGQHTLTEGERRDLGRLTLTPTGSLSIQVTGASGLEPYARARIVSNPGGETARWIDAGAHTGIALFPGRYDVSLWSATAALEARVVEVVAGRDTRLELEPRPGLACRVEVELRRDPPPFVLTCALFDATGQRLAAWWQNPDGELTALRLSLSPGDYRLDVETEDGARGSVDFTAAVAGSATTRLVLE